MVFLGMNLNMSIVASIGYCIEVVGKEGQGEQEIHYFVYSILTI